MTNKEKLEVLKSFLKEKDIVFAENLVRKGQLFHLFIGKYLICVRLSDENDQKFYEQIKYAYHPLFIRDSETAEFVVEKMHNLINDITNRQKEKLATQTVEKPKRKRVHIPKAERVTPFKK